MRQIQCTDPILMERKVHTARPKEQAMQAVRFVGVGRPAQIEEIPVPSPWPGQVVVRIGGAGVCHSDLHIMEEDLGFTPPFTLGHENAGWVSAVGEGVMGFKDGDAVDVCARLKAGQITGRAVLIPA